MSHEPGELVGRGRAADVFALDDHRVLRRYRDGHECSSEAEAMRYLADRGYPVPEVFDASGPDIVMARLDGSTMLTTLGRAPWRIAPMARLLAELQRQLNAIAPIDSMPTRFGHRDGVVHLDLHPDNVMLTREGPVVIDFSNVAAGPTNADVAASWIIMATSTVPGSSVERAIGSLGRAWMVHSFLRGADRDDARAKLSEVGEWRKRDSHVSDLERRRIDRLVGAHGSR